MFARLQVFYAGSEGGGHLQQTRSSKDDRARRKHGGNVRCKWMSNSAPSYSNSYPTRS
jgi:hypothetical protein